MKITYHREPTKDEIKFGYGATHYLEVDVEKVIRKDGKVKRWFLNKEDGLRYYY